MNKREKTTVIHTDKKVMKLVYAGLLTAIGIVLPQAFHVFGQSAGMVFLPIHIPVLMAGILLGPCYGAGVGLLVPLLSSLLTGMPPVPKLYFMFFELIGYGFFTGLFMKKANVYVSLIGAMLAGRACYALSLIGGVYLLHMQAPFMNQAAFIGGISSGIPGMVIQILVLPVLYLALKKGGYTFE